jgi:GNAT superfamily N-acetyltransferase
MAARNHSYQPVASAVRPTAESAVLPSLGDSPTANAVHDLTAEQRPLFHIRELRERRTLDASLSENRPYAAYALGHLEAKLLERSRFWLADGDGNGVVMHATAMGRTMFVGGDTTAVGAILSLHPGPRSSYLTTCAPEHLPMIERTHVLYNVLRMTRMSVTQASFSEARGVVRRLHRGDVRSLNALYALGGAHGHYGGDHIERGVYYGAFDGARLVSVAGTHIVAPAASIAIVGNVFTHPAQRGRGLATAVTCSVTRELFDRGCALVTLTVDPANTHAVRAYRRIGYIPGANVVEARTRRRSLLSLKSWIRRQAARRRVNGRYGFAGEYAPGQPLTSPGRLDE